MRIRLWLIAGLGLIVLFAGFGRWSAPGKIATYDAVRQSWQASRSALLDRHGAVLQVRRTDFAMRRGEWADLTAISPALQSAIIAAEDKRFYRHHGIDWHGVFGAAWNNARGQPLRGASTITMQLATLLRSRDGQSFARRSLRAKMKQARYARALETRWTKAQIFETYLNILSFRGEIEGITAAANVLLGKTPDALTENESLALAVLLPAPNASHKRLYNRLCARRPGEACTGPQAALTRMLDRAETPPAAPDLAPHLAARLLTAQHPHVRTTLDVTIQRYAKAALARQLSALAHRNVRDGAILVVDNASGDVLAWVGSNPATSRAPHVDGVRAHRQAGSTLKPHLYALAIERRYLTAASLLNDAPIHLETAGGLYVPQNYDHGYKGLVSARLSLGNSLNIPAVRTLLLTGVEPFRQRLYDLGYNGITRDGDYYGFSLALGSAEVSLAEQVNAYRTLANGGRASPLRLRPDDPTTPAKQILPKTVGYIVSSMLSDRSARLMTFGLSNNLNTPFWSAVKTGTSKAMRDNWCIGYSEKYTVGVWVGNFEGDPMHGVSGVSGAAPLWHDVMSMLHQNTPSLPPTPPPGVSQADIYFIGTPEAPRREVFLDGTVIKAIHAVPQSTRAARIVRPAAGAIIALDPDIPTDRQRMAIALRGKTKDMTLSLDGKTLPKDKLWFPLPGKHHLKLIDKSGKTIDQVRFTVRAPGG
ncbi:MAG: penicillin-binding protein 1C [Robiginitomaculum sp.]|nr:MAG: penicillin-binding protein 1C [Robiginitomaculum sp.]